MSYTYADRKKSAKPAPRIDAAQPSARSFSDLRMYSSWCYAPLTEFNHIMCLRRILTRSLSRLTATAPFSKGSHASAGGAAALLSSIRFLFYNNYNAFV